jgi:hypothetical protein
MLQESISEDFHGNQASLQRGIEMTKFKTYKYGPYTFKSYCKPVGKGFEVGFTYHGRNYFVGNFIHKAEATKWWSQFNKEITTFSKKFSVSDEMPFQWYCNFLSNHLYKCYYSWLDKAFTKYETVFKKAYSKDYKRYVKFAKEMHPSDRYSFYQTAA